MDSGQKTRIDLASSAGIIILEDDNLSKVIVSWETLCNKVFEALGKVPVLEDAYQILEDRTDDPAFAMIQIIGMCLKHPGHKTWAMAFGGEGEFMGGVKAIYWIPVKDTDEAIRLVKRNIVRVRKLLRK